MKKMFLTLGVAACVISAVAFGGCAVGEAEVTFALSEDGTHYVVSGVEGDTRGLKEYEVPASYTGADGVELPVTEIGTAAFAKCYYLAKVTLPDSVTKIGNFGFYWSGIKSIEIPASVTEIGEYAFGYCDLLKEIYVPSTVTVLKDRAFYGCSALETAYINASVTDIADGLLENRYVSQGGNTFSSTSLTKVYFGASVNKINVTSLMGNVITDIYYAGSEEQWDSLYFYELVQKADKPEETEERKCDKKTVMGTTKVHFNVEF